MQKTVLFLDFDGVICSVRNHVGFDSDACAKIQQICDETGAEVCVTSTRREATVENTISYCISLWLENYPDQDPPKWMTSICGVTERGYHRFRTGLRRQIPRGVEIQWWIEDNIDEWYIVGSHNYVIIDDDTDMLLGQRDHFVNTDPQIGITDDDVRNAISILKK